MLLDTIRTNGVLSCKSSIENGSAVNVRTSNSLDWTCNSRNDELISSCQWECKQSQCKCSVHFKIHGHNNYDTVVTYTTVLQHSPPELLKAQSLHLLATSLFFRLVLGHSVHSDNASPASSSVAQSPMSSGSSFQTLVETVAKSWLSSREHAR